MPLPSEPPLLFILEPCLCKLPPVCTRKLVPEGPCMVQCRTSRALRLRGAFVWQAPVMLWQQQQPCALHCGATSLAAPVCVTDMLHLCMCRYIAEEEAAEEQAVEELIEQVFGVDGLGVAPAPAAAASTNSPSPASPASPAAASNSPAANTVQQALGNNPTGSVPSSSAGVRPIALNSGR